MHGLAWAYPVPCFRLLEPQGFEVQYSNIPVSVVENMTQLLTFL